MAVDTKQRRAHIVMPTALLNAVDAEVGPRKRSQFVQEAVEEKLWRKRMLASLDEMAGSLKDADIPEWETSDAAAEWVRSLRRGDAADGAAVPDGEVREPVAS